MEGVDPRLQIFLIAFGAFATVVFILIISHDYRRRKRLPALAAEMGFTYQRENAHLLEQFEGFRLFPQGINRHATNVLHGESWRTAIWLFDFSLRTRGKRDCNYTVCALRSPELNVPYFFLSCEVPGLDSIGPFLVKKRILTKSEAVGEAIFAELGAGDIDFPEDEKFSKKFVLQGEKEAVRALFDAEVRHHLMRFAGTLVSIEGRGDSLVFTPGRLVLPKDVRGVIQQATDLVTLFAQRTAPR